MAWITPEAWPVPAPVTNIDLARIEGNIDYIYNTGIKPNTDASWVMGRGKLYSSSPDHGSWAHFDYATATGYAIRQSSLGVTTLNGTSVDIRIDNAQVATLSGSAISLLKPTTITGNLTVNSNGILDYNSTSKDLTLYNTFSSDDANIGFNMNFGGETRIMTLKRIGRVGINTNDPQSALDINGNISLTGAATRGITGSLNQSMFIDVLGNADTEGFLIKQNGVEKASFLRDGSFNVVGNINPTTTPTESTITLTAGSPTQLVPRGQYHIKLNSTGGSMSVIVQKKYGASDWQIIDNISGITTRSTALLDSSGDDLRLSAGGVIASADQTLRKY